MAYIYRTSLFLFLSCFFMIQLSMGNARMNSEIPRINLSLKINKSMLRYGEEPRFTIKIKNVSSEILLVLNIKNRPDLQDNYSKLVITSFGRPVKMSETVSDPGPISMNDYVAIAPGKSFEIILGSLTFQISKLKPGKYSAHIEYLIDPINMPNEKYRSADVVFTIPQ